MQWVTGLMKRIAEVPLSNRTDGVCNLFRLKTCQNWPAWGCQWYFGLQRNRRTRSPQSLILGTSLWLPNATRIVQTAGVLDSLYLRRWSSPIKSPRYKLILPVFPQCYKLGLLRRVALARVIWLGFRTSGESSHSLLVLNKNMCNLILYLKKLVQGPMYKFACRLSGTCKKTRCLS